MIWLDFRALCCINLHIDEEKQILLKFFNILRCGVHINTTHVLREDKYIDIKYLQINALICLINYSICIIASVCYIPVILEGYQAAQVHLM